MKYIGYLVSIVWVVVFTIWGVSFFVQTQSNTKCETGKVGSLGFKCVDGKWQKDFWEEQKDRAREAKEAKKAYEIRYAQMVEFCGKGNVWAGSGDNPYTPAIFGCQDYSKVPDSSLLDK